MWQMCVVYPRCYRGCREVCWAPTGHSVCSVCWWVLENWKAADLLLFRPAPPRSVRQYHRWVAPHPGIRTHNQRWGRKRRPHIFVVVGVDLSLQQGEQVVETAGELLLLDLHEQPTNLSAESPKTDLGWEDPYFRPQESLVGMWSTNDLLCVEPRVDEGEQRVLVICVQLGQERLDGQGCHFLTTRRGVVDHYQSQGGEEEAAVLQQQLLHRDKNTHKFFFF